MYVPQNFIRCFPETQLDLGTPQFCLLTPCRVKTAQGRGVRVAPCAVRAPSGLGLALAAGVAWRGRNGGSDREGAARVHSAGPEMGLTLQARPPSSHVGWGVAAPSAPALKPALPCSVDFPPGTRGPLQGGGDGQSNLSPSQNPGSRHLRLPG